MAALSTVLDDSVESGRSAGKMKIIELGVVMKPILKWQYDQIVKELLLLQEHEADPTCPCETEGERCVRKHLMTLEGYAQETLPMEPNEKYKDALRKFGDESKEQREQEEKSLCGKGESVNVLEWSRYWRKQFEGYSLACENIQASDANKS